MTEDISRVPRDVLNVVPSALKLQIMLFSGHLRQIDQIFFSLIAQGNIADSLGIPSSSENVDYAEQRNKEDSQSD